MMKKCDAQKSGFTLVEILVVLAVVALLAAILFGVFSRMREKGRSAVCQSNLKQIALAFQQYVQDHDGWYPQPATAQANSQRTDWASYLFPYVTDKQVFICPSNVDSINAVFKEANTTYEYNGFVVQRLNTSPRQIRLKTNHHETVIRKPSNVILNFDLGSDREFYTEVPVSSAGCTDPGVTSAPYLYMPSLHSGSANYSFYDGHVKWLNPETAAKIGCDSQLKP